MIMIIIIIILIIIMMIIKLWEFDMGKLFCEVKLFKATVYNVRLIMHVINRAFTLQ